MTSPLPLSSGSPQAVYNWFKANMAVILVVSTLWLFVSKSLYNVPVGIMAVIGLWQTLRNPGHIWQNLFIRAYIILFLCLWGPLLISLVDAVNFARSATTTFSYLRFLFFGIYILSSIKKPEDLQKINLFVFYLVSFWCVDAVIQYLFKADLFGYPYVPGNITGVFYPRNTIAHVCASLSPLYFETIRKNAGRYKWLWFLLPPLFITILLSGRRAAWIMLFISVTGYLFYLYKASAFNTRFLQAGGLTGIIIVLAAATLITTDPSIQNRISDTRGLFSGDYETIDNATARRLPLWKTSITMFMGNWINGVGPRGYRYVYRTYCDRDDYWALTGAQYPATHPHQIILEVLAETGIIGAFGLALFVIIFYRNLKTWRLSFVLFPWALGVIVAVFPVNTHMAFYGAYWSSVIWWLLALTVAAAGTTANGPFTPANPPGETLAQAH